MMMVVVCDVCVCRGCICVLGMVITDHYSRCHRVTIVLPLCRVVTEGPCMGMCVQKFDDRAYLHDAWGDAPHQRVGVCVRSERLIKLYRDTIIDLNNSRRQHSRL